VETTQKALLKTLRTVKTRLLQ